MRWGFFYLRRPLELEKGEVDLAVSGVCRAGVGERKGGTGRGADDECGRAGGTGAVGGGGKLDAGLQVGKPIVAGRHLHVIGLTEQARH